MQKTSGPYLKGTILDFSRRQNVVFWIGQCAVVLSTIVGVYLAASEGLKSAVEFHAATSLEKKYFTLNSLRKEVESNNALILAFSEANLVKDENGNYSSHRSMLAPELNWFVWVTMSRSPETLDLPVDILHDVNRYYIQLTKLMSDYQQGSGRDKLISGRRLFELAQQANEELMGRMDEQITSYQQRLAKYATLGSY